MQVKWQRYFSAEFEAEDFPFGKNPLAQNCSTKNLKGPLSVNYFFSVNVLKANVEDVKMEGVGLKTNKWNTDSSQDQMQYDLVPKLYSSAAHNFPVVSG